ncbi:MAG: F0F1 ATP synthase subunit B [Gemmatimonadetes bacterium]|nr:F0F1 ATP synthase subunit B [Gemmatimonadota bacterium]
MRLLKLAVPALGSLALAASPLLAQEHAAVSETAKPGLLTVDGGLMFWTLIVFALIFGVLAKFVFPQILGAVQAREAALLKAIEEAKADRDAAAKLLAEHQAKIEAARGEAQKFIAEGRATAESMKADMLEETRKQQQELLERARRDIESEKVAAIAELRREAVGLAIAAAGKVIEKNLDDAQNKKLVEGYLAGMQ